MVKDFAKACAEYADPPLPREVGLVLYYASIAAARLRWGVQLSDLSGEEMKKGIQWALAQPWLEDTCRKLLVGMDQSLQHRNGP